MPEVVLLMKMVTSARGVVQLCCLRTSKWLEQHSMTSSRGKQSRVSSLRPSARSLRLPWGRTSILRPSVSSLRLLWGHYNGAVWPGSLITVAHGWSELCGNYECVTAKFYYDVMGLNV